MMSWYFFVSNTNDAFALYNFFTKMLIKNGAALHVLFSSTMALSVVKTLGVYHFDDPGFHTLLRSTSFL